ncbi:MAG: hypothetical protein BWY56_00501 [Acidobacteria bacterium ADurb.Bin340]|nr:MAG: hypothetical protein BWY56_00501 [Acidobacteria bacterium ADurb.Bin340]
MKMSRKAKRYDDSVLPGDFHDFEPFQTGDPARDGRVEGALRRRGAALELEHLVVERTSSRKQSFAKLRSKAEDLTRQVDYLLERLEIVDHDRRGMYIQLRSLPPYKDDTQIQFNEISIARDRVLVKRIAFYRKDEVKQQVPLQLTEEQFQRLLGDIRSVFAAG